MEKEGRWLNRQRLMGLSSLEEVLEWYGAVWDRMVWKCLLRLRER
jgi:hypothetical protein